MIMLAVKACFITFRVGAERANSPDSLVKDALQVPLGQGRAFKVLVCLNLFGADQGLIIRYGLHSLLPQRVESRRILSKIKLGADQDDGNVRRMVVNLGVPLWHSLSV